MKLTIQLHLLGLCDKPTRTTPYWNLTQGNQILTERTYFLLLNLVLPLWMSQRFQLQDEGVQKHFKIYFFSVASRAASGLSNTAEFHVFPGIIYLNCHRSGSRCCLKNFWEMGLSSAQILCILWLVEECCFLRSESFRIAKGSSCCCFGDLMC